MNFLNSIKDANLEIHALLKKVPHEKLCENVKIGVGGDMGTLVDFEAEKIFVKHLKSYGKIYSEESGFIGEGENTIILDPIDGSKNFNSNIPFYGTSVALKSDDNISHAVVTNLVTGDMFIKTKDIFAKYSLFNNNRSPFYINKFSSVGIFEKAYSSSLHVGLKKLNLKYRSNGALALSLALSYDVEFVVFEGYTREFDIVAGWKICEDLYRFKNDNFLLVSKDKIIFDKICKLIQNEG